MEILEMPLGVKIISTNYCPGCGGAIQPNLLHICGQLDEFLSSPCQPVVDEKPTDWGQIYTVSVDGKVLEAVRFLARWALETELPPLSVIGAADCVHCWQSAVRKQDDRRQTND